MKMPTPREWIDPKTGKTYYRVRSCDSNGKVVQRAFSDIEEADKYCAELKKSRDKHGRASAVGSDEIDALRIWREYIAKEHTAGRDTPALRDVIRTAIERLKDGSTTPALDDLRQTFIDAREREAVSASHLAALKNRLKHQEDLSTFAQTINSTFAQSPTRAVPLLGNLPEEIIVGYEVLIQFPFRVLADHGRGQYHDLDAGRLGLIKDGGDVLLVILQRDSLECLRA